MEAGNLTKLVVAALLAAGTAGCTTVKDYVEDAGFIYTDPPSKNYVVGSIFVVQTSLRTGSNVFLTVCFNDSAAKDLADSIKVKNGEMQGPAKIHTSPGPKEVEAMTKIAAKGAITITDKAKQALLESADPTVKAGVELLSESKLVLTNISYQQAEPGYLGNVAIAIGKQPTCGGDGQTDTLLASWRAKGIKTYHSMMILTATAEVSHTFSAGASAAVTTPLVQAINASLSATGTLESANSSKLEGLVLGLRVWDPDCPLQRIDVVPKAATKAGECH